MHLLTDINDHYQALVHDIGGEYFRDATPSAQKLELKIVKHFGNRIKIEKGKTKRGNVIYSTVLTTEEALREQHDQISDINIQIKKVAFALRESRSKAEHRTLPENLTLEDMYKGEIDVPELVLDFFTYLIGGPDSRCCSQPSKQRRINSINQDAIFAATSGQKNPGKHLVIGMTLKSLTGSRKVVDMMNRLGHCVSYNTTEELETELTFEANKDRNATPHGMVRSADSGTGTVWDNFDRFVETVVKW